MTTDHVLEMLFQEAVDTRRGCEGCLYAHYADDLDPGDSGPINGLLSARVEYFECQAERPVDCQEVLLLVRELVLRCEEGFPQRYAAASLKLCGRGRCADWRALFSAALCCGLIEATAPTYPYARAGWFSAALCCGLIEA